MEVLPDELVRLCLLRVPYNSHATLKAVCKGWEAMVSSPQFYADRKISGTSQQLICLSQLDWTVDHDHVFTLTLYDPDPEKGTRETLPPIDEPECRGIPIYCECVAVNRKLVLIGGIHPSRTDLRKSVYIYDLESTRWIRGADMPTPRCHFARSVCSSTGLIYIAGGKDEHHRPLASAEAYNVEEDTWEILPPMIQPHGEGCQGAFLEGEFIVVKGHQSDRSAEAFDPSAGTWRRLENMWSFGQFGGVIATCSGDLYTVADFRQEIMGYDVQTNITRDIMKYDVQTNIWTTVASLPDPDVRSALPMLGLRHNTHVRSAIQWRDFLFVVALEFFNKRSHFFLFNPSTKEIQVNSDGYEEIGEIVSSIAVEI